MANGSRAHQQGKGIAGGPQVTEEPEDELTIPGQPGPLAGGRLPNDVLAVPGEGLDGPAAAGEARGRSSAAGSPALSPRSSLRRQGHEPLVLEAQHRVGGRVYTLRDFAPGLYAEAGAMRIPRVHDLTLALLRPVRPASCGRS